MNLLMRTRNTIGKRRLNNVGYPCRYYKLHPEFLKTYKIYYEDESNLVFVGTAVHSDRYHKLVADKVFIREHP